MQTTNKRLSIVIDSKIPFIKGVLEPYAEVIYEEGANITPHTIANADALIIRTRTRCDEQLLKNSSVRFIATATIGTDHIDTNYCDLNNIRWTNAAGCNSGSVYQYIASCLAWLATTKQISLSPTTTLGVIGCGHVGSKIVNLGKTLGLNVLINDPPLERTKKGDFVSLKHLLRHSDIITVHTPLTKSGVDATYHLLNQQTLSFTKSSAWLINSSRGEVIDERALEEAFTQKRFKGFILDVWENEPNVNISLLQKSALGTPHIAGYSADGKAMATQMSVRSLANYFGLDLLTWTPELIPSPQNDTLISIDAKQKCLYETFCEAVLSTYTPTLDDSKLRNAPTEFETQRGNYPIRREFQAYQLLLQNDNSQIAKTLSTLGFQTTLS